MNGCMASITKVGCQADILSSLFEQSKLMFRQKMVSMFGKPLPLSSWCNDWMAWLNPFSVQALIFQWKWSLVCLYWSVAGCTCTSGCGLLRSSGICRYGGSRVSYDKFIYKPLQDVHKGRLVIEEGTMGANCNWFVILAIWPTKQVPCLNVISHTAKAARTTLSRFQSVKAFWLFSNEMYSAKECRKEIWSMNIKFDNLATAKSNYATYDVVFVGATQNIMQDKKRFVTTKWSLSSTS